MKILCSFILFAVALIATASAQVAIPWDNVDKTGTSLADLATRSASDLNSGTLPDARLSANVSLLGSSIDWTAEVSGKPTTLAGFGITDASPISRNIATTAPLTGGGDFTSNRTLSISTATTSGTGAVQLATSVEASDGTDTAKALTPATAEAREAAKDYRKLKAAVLASVSQKIQYGRKAMFLHYGDSLVNGSSGGSYMTTFVPAIERAMGSGGAGFFDAFANAGGSRGLIVATQTGSWWDTNLINWGAQGWTAQNSPDTSGDGRFGFSGRGIYQAAANGSQLLRFRPQTRGFTRATLFYLEKSGGGSFDFGKTGNVSSVSCSGASSVMRTVSRRIWDGTVEDNEVLISNCSGAVYLYGILFENDEVAAVTAIGGQGGQTAAVYTGLDATSFTAYITALSPAAVVLNLGTNDGGSPAATYKANMQTLITRVRNSDAAVPIVLTVPYTGNIPANYLIVLGELSAENANVFVHYWRDILGPNGTGFLEDSIHPNAAGCAMLGKGYVELFGGLALPNPKTWPWPAPFVRDNAIFSPSRNSYFTATGTDWTTSGGGGPALNYVQGTGLQVTSGGTFTGITLSLSTHMGSAMKAGRLYYVRVRLGAGSGAILYPTPGSSGLAGWPLVSTIANTGQFLAANTDYIWVVRPTGDITDMRILHPGAGGTFTVALFEIRELSSTRSRLRTGTVTLVAGTATITDANTTTATRVTLSMLTPGGTVGAQYVSAKSAGTSFTVTSTNASDTSTLYFEAFEP